VLSFDELSHEYRWNGVRVPNVTSVLKPLSDYSNISPAVLENAREEGVQIHKMIELDLKGDLDIESLPEWIEPYWRAWHQFKVHSGLRLIASEHRMCHPSLQYAGTCDIVASMPKFKNLNQNFCVIDIKRSLFGGPVIGLQLAAYADLWNAQKPTQRIKHRFAFQPRKDGTYRLEEFSDPADLMTFQALLVVHKWRLKNAK
jgi:hypothetical protein